MQLPFEKIYSADLIHPQERKAMLSCQKNLLYDWLADQASSLKKRIGDRADAVLHAYPVTKFTAPRLNNLYELVLTRLDCKEKFPLYINFEYDINFEVSGSPTESYVIFVNHTILDELTDEEILALLGQAVGRIKANQVHNLQLLKILENVAGALPFFGPFVEKELWSTFAEWNIAAQFTIDRSALSACGSEKAVVSLLLKQTGLTNANLENIFSQRVKKTDKLGIYFIWLMQSLPVFGGIERIQELHNWTHSEDFKQEYPGFYHKILLEDENNIEEETPLLNLHKNARAGNRRAIVTLADKYFYGQDLPKSKFMAESLYKTAAFLGDARAMYIFAAFLNQASKTSNQKFVRRLQEAAASRGFEPAQKKLDNISPVRFDLLLEKICKSFDSNYNNQTDCKTTFDEEDAERIRRAFWMNKGEKIFAQEIYSNLNDELFGISITSTGIYGRISEEFFPYYVSWEDMRNSELQKRWLDDDKEYLTLGNIALYRIEKSLKGTAAEFLITIALKLKHL